VALLLVACGASPERKQLDQTKGFVVRRLLEIRRDGMQYTQFGEMQVSGVSPLPLIMTGAPPGLSPVLFQEPPQAWTVRLSFAANGHVAVDLYDADVSKPVDHMQVDMRVM